MSKSPDKLFCWNFQTKDGGWEKGWGGYSRQTNLHPMSEHERNTGGVYILMEAHLAEVEAAVKRALEGAAEEIIAMRGPLDVPRTDKAVVFDDACERCIEIIRALTPAQFIDGGKQ